ncbi:hypothetical protein SAMN05660745_02223 [Corynebacterium glucuronolyticum]|nr:hypothetical protein CGLUCO_05640 [Corynebacterium glucuronolyticum DSM 44120]SMB79450.1 hypothetical protein SAMN05660745_02223 [Corynebacterium glucuronolyticum]
MVGNDPYSRALGNDHCGGSLKLFTITERPKHAFEYSNFADRDRLK